MADFFAPETAPFAVALTLMAFIAILEIGGMLIGLSPSGALDSLLPEIDLDADLDVDADFAGGPFDVDAPAAPDAPGAGPLSQVLGWLCVGRVPVLVLLVAFLTAFGISGFVFQGLVQGVVGAALPAALAAIPALAIAVPATRFMGLGLAKVMPKEHTEAVSSRSFVGKVATVIRGEARRGLAAEAKLTDGFGQTHYLLVEPDNDGETFDQGDEVLVVRKASGVYRVIASAHPAMLDR
ncbi:MAG: YqiJ family protein [Pseudomonadota bacterium]